MFRSGLMVTIAILALALLVLGCGSAEEKKDELAPLPLRVAVAADYPPVIFKTGEIYSGVEADMARALGAALGRPVEFVEVKRPRLVTELLRRGADIIMSGFSVTRARGLRVAFADSYHGNALLGMCRIGEDEQFDTPEKIMNATGRIGAPRGTTADSWIQRNCPNAKKVLVGTPDGGGFELRRKRIDCFIYDAHAIAWLVSQNEAEFVPTSLVPLEQEDLAWAVRRNDVQLLDQVNDVLRTWKSDGTLERILRRWFAYYDTSKEWRAPAE